MSPEEIKALKASLGCCTLHTTLVGLYSIQEQLESGAGASSMNFFRMGASFVLLALMGFHLTLAAVVADMNPRLKVYVPGCIAAAVLALAVRASWFILRIDVQDLAIVREVFLMMVSIQAGILLELATGFFRRARIPPRTRA